MSSRPGFLAKWRAGRGVRHSSYAVGVGYRSVFERVVLTKKELGHHGAVFGAPGSGKTTTLSLLVQGHSSYGPCIVVDGKGSLGLQAAIHAAGGLVWTIGGPLKLDLLDADPTVLAEQMTEAARHEGPSEVYSEAAARAIQWIGHVLVWQGKHPTLEAVEALLLPDRLALALEPFKTKPRVAQWLAELANIGDMELSGMRSALMRTTRLLDSAAGRSLGTGSDAVRLEDVVQGTTTLLVSLDARRYPGLTKILGGWALLALQRACLSVPKGASCLMVVDEVGSFGRQARHIEPLLALARDVHVGVVVAAHGPTQLDATMHGLASLVLQETAWQIVLRQGDPYDADRLSMLFPLDEREKVTLGTHASGVPNVTRDHLRGMAVGECAYWVSAVNRQEARWGQARVAWPTLVELPVRLALPAPAGGITDATGEDLSDLTEAYPETTEEQPTTEAELKELVYGNIVDTDGWRTWKGSVDPNKYPRIWVPVHHRDWKTKQWVGGYEFAYRLLYRWEVGEIPKQRTIDHTCGLKPCMEAIHLEAVTGAENTRRRHARERGELAVGHPQRIQQPLEMPPCVERVDSSTAADTFAIALFAGIDKPAVDQQTVGLDELRPMLSTFEVLLDKRRGRCWSPTRYTDGASSRGNAGVLEVSALVFDLDKVPPDPERLAGVYWLGHTTWSHTAQAPRWRVVIPLTAPVPATAWRDAWQRARAALCPEADPACKDPSRAYWLPSHSGGVTAKATCHDGPLLDVSTLPALPAEPRHAELRRSPTALHPRTARDADQRRGEAYMTSVLAKLESMAPNSGRNDALNRAAWTLGRWIAAGALEQSDVEDELYAAAARNGLVGDDGERQCWATIRSGLGSGLQQPIDLDADGREPTRRRNNGRSIG